MKLKPPGITEAGASPTLPPSAKEVPAREPTRMRGHSAADDWQPAKASAVERVPASPAERRDIAYAAANLLRGAAAPGLLAVADAIRSGAIAAPRALEAQLTELRAGRSADWSEQSSLALLAWAAAEPGKELARRVLDAVRATALLPAGTGNDLPWIGDRQNRLAHWMRQHAPELLAETVAALPELGTPLPALAASSERLAQRVGRPLGGFNVAVIGHVLAEAPAFISALEALGLDSAATRIVGVPYSSNELVAEALRLRGYRTEIPHGREGAQEGRWGGLVDANVAFRGTEGRPRFAEIKEESIARLLADMIVQADANGRPILIIDDGGYAAKVAKQRFPEQLHRIRFVEQTTRGIRQIEAAGGISSLTINVAESELKRVIEAPFVAEAIADAIRSSIGGLSAGSFADARVGIIGYGAIGRSTALSLRGLGATVTVFDTDPSKMALARADGMQGALDKRQALEAQGFVIGATGRTSLDADDYMMLSPGTILMSTSSADIEFLESWQNAQSLGVARELYVDALAAPLEGRSRPPPAGVDIALRVELPGSQRHGTRMSREEIMSNQISRAFTDSLEESLAKYGGAVSVRVSGTVGFIDLGERLAGILEKREWWGREKTAMAEAAITHERQRPPVWLLNGGYPVNLSRRLVSMPPERIQITMAALVAGAVQAATYTGDPAHAGVTDLDREMQRELREDFTRHTAPVQAPGSV